MNSIRRFQYKPIFVLAVIYFAGILSRFIKIKFPFDSASIIVFSAAAIYWAVTVNVRIIHRFQKSLLIGIAAMVLLLHFAQFMRYEFAVSHAAIRYLWYLYYVPMIIAPVLGIWTASSIGRPEGDYEGKWLLLSVPALVLIVFVLTNDMHHKMFYFSPYTNDPTAAYARKPLYYVVSVWCYALPVAALIVALWRTKLVFRKRHALIPFLVEAAGFLLLLVFYGSTSAGSRLLTFQMIWNMIQILFWESCIMIGLIPSNTDYIAIFNNSSVRAQILDEDGNIVYMANDTAPVPEAIRNKTGTFTETSMGSVKLFGRRIKGGFIYWQEDISALLALNRELTRTGERLKESNTLLSEENALMAEKVRIETYSRLYDDIAGKVSVQRGKILSLLEEPEEGKLKDDFCARVLYASVLIAYIKRTANLMLTGQEQDISASDLALCVKESIEYLSLSGVIGDVDSDRGTFPAGTALQAYALFEEIIENGYEFIGVIMVWIRSKDRSGLRIELSQKRGTDENDWMRFEEFIRTLAIRSGQYRLFAMDARDDGALYLQVLFEDGGGSQ